jgi:hypothetical protein
MERDDTALVLGGNIHAALRLDHAAGGRPELGFGKPRRMRRGAA